MYQNFILKLGQNQLTSKPVINKNCVACGKCASECPTGAIDSKTYKM